MDVSICEEFNQPGARKTQEPQPDDDGRPTDRWTTDWTAVVIFARDGAEMHS